MVGLSGGVDSSVAAALLRREGHDVYGVFIKVWQADFLPCDWRSERRHAMRAAAHLEIPFLTLDLEQEYKKGVVDYLIREYRAGRTPNPDVMCNKEVKFGSFLSFAIAHGMDGIATGHYARIVRESDGGSALFEGKDKEKDQSYFLWTLTEKELARVSFPLGDMTKPGVRATAKRLGLPNAEKKDSQGICFLGTVDMTDFLRHFLDVRPGTVLDVRGTPIGTHNGAALYTIGQRHGFKIEQDDPHSKASYVVAKDIERNTITVADEASKKDYAPITVLALRDISFTRETYRETVPLPTSFRYRYHGVKIPAKASLLGKNGIALEFKTPLSDVSPGQSCVLYQNERVLGGGIITE